MVHLKHNQTMHTILLVLVVLHGAALRLFKLGEWSFWIDEIFTLRRATSLFDQGILPALVTGSPSTLLVATTTSLLGVSEWSARLAPALIGIASIPLLYLPVRQLYGSTIALIAGFLLAVAPWHIYFSQNARYYTALLLFSMLAFFLFYAGLESRRPWPYLLCFLLCMGLAFQERLFALFLLPVVLAYSLLLPVLPFGRPAGARPGSVLVTLTVICVLAIGYLVYDLAFADATHRSVVRRLLLAFVGRPDWHPRWLLTGAIHHITVPVACLALYGGLLQLSERRRAGLLLVLGALLPLGLLMALAPFVRTTTHYALMILPCWIILAAIATHKLYEHARAGRLLPVLFWATLILLVSLQDYTFADVRHYLGETAGILLFVTLGAFLPLLAVITLLGRVYARRRRHDARQSGAHLAGLHLPRSASMLVWITGILLPLLWYPLITGTLYYGYRHGNRADWKSAAAVVSAHTHADEPVFTTLLPLGTYYFGTAARSIGDLQHQQHRDLAHILQAEQRVWVIEEAGVSMLMGDSFRIWAHANCECVAVLDHYMSGRNWVLRVHHCEKPS